MIGTITTCFALLILGSVDGSASAWARAQWVLILFAAAGIVFVAVFIYQAFCTPARFEEEAATKTKEMAAASQKAIMAIGDRDRILLEHQADLENKDAEIASLKMQIGQLRTLVENSVAVRPKRVTHTRAQKEFIGSLEVVVQEYHGLLHSDYMGWCNRIVSMLRGAGRLAEVDEFLQAKTMDIMPNDRSAKAYVDSLILRLKDEPRTT